MRLEQASVRWNEHVARRGVAAVQVLNRKNGASNRNGVPGKQHNQRCCIFSARRISPRANRAAGAVSVSVPLSSDIAGRRRKTAERCHRPGSATTVESVGNSRCGSNMAIFSIGAAPTAWVEPFRTHICTHAGLPTLSSVEEAATLLNADRMIDIRSYICSGAAGCSISSPLQRAAARRRQSDHLPPARRGVKGHRRSPLLLHLTFAATPTGIHFFTQARSSACRQLTVGAPPATHRRDS